MAMSTLAGLSRFKKQAPPPPRIIKAKADMVLLALMAFKQPYKMRKAFLIPKDRAAWLEYMLQLVKKKHTFKYLSDKELKKIIQRFNPNLAKKFPPLTRDPDLPDSVYWTEEEVADWIESIGFPHLKNVFLENFISGRKLIHLDASAINKMGVQDFEEIKKVAGRIRNVLQLRRPSMLHTLARVVPYKKFLKLHARTGETYNSLTFKKFCEDNGLPYGILRRDKSAMISLVTCNVPAQPAPAEEEESGDDMSLDGTPSVEYIVRHQIVRNHTIQRIIDEVFSRIFDPNRVTSKVEPLDAMIRRILDEALLELGFGDPALYTRERLEFAGNVAERLFKDIMRTVAAMNDIKTLEEHLKHEIEAEHIKPEDVEYMRDVAVDFMEEIVPISVMLALDEYSLENVFKEQPEFQEYVDGVIAEAEAKTNERVPDAEEALHEVLSEAKLKVVAQEEFPFSSLEAVRSAKKTAQEITEDVLEKVRNPEDADGSGNENFGNEQLQL